MQLHLWWAGPSADSVAATAVTRRVCLSQCGQLEVPGVAECRCGWPIPAVRHMNSSWTCRPLVGVAGGKACCVELGLACVRQVRTRLSPGTVWKFTQHTCAAYHNENKTLEKANWTVPDHIHSQASGST